MTLDEIDKQISDLKIQRRSLYLKEIEEFQKQAQINIGRCFKISEKEYAKVIGIPQIDDYKSGIEFNRYQYSAVYISLNDETDFPVYYDFIHSGAWGEGGNSFNGKCEEISAEEFNHILRTTFDVYYFSISSIGCLNV